MISTIGNPFVMLATTWYAKKIGGSPDQIVSDLITQELDSHQ